VGSSQMVLSFQLAGTDEALFGEYLHGFGVGNLIDRELPAPGSAAGYSPSVHVLPLVLMLAGGGRTLEDLRVLRRDEGLRAVLLPQLNETPSSDATGDWLRRTGAKEGGGLVGLQHVNGSVFRRLLLSDEGVDYTLDFDETQIVAEKHEARYTYKGEKGYMPMVGHIAELGVVIGHEFREGNAAPAAARNLEFLQACERNMPKGKRIVAVRADSAAYPAAIFNWCEVTAKVFAIGADQDAAVKAAIAGFPESDWNV
jgi:Transposase DDE domain group 1